MNKQRVIQYALSIREDYRDDFGEVNLTQLDEALQDHFDIDQNKYDDEDISFLVFKELEKRNLL